MRASAFAILAIIFSSAVALADDIAFSRGETVLVVAPHPDDEALGAGGLIRAAVEAGADVRVVYFTHGESNELSSIFYNKRPMILTKDFLKKGRLRREEAIAAMTALGVPAKNLYFFGYPDLGTLRVWERYWTGQKPFRSFFSRVNKVSHPEDYSFGSYFFGYNILSDFERLLREVRPSRVLVTAPFDLNSDHQAAYLFVQTALLNLEPEMGRPFVHLYVVHAADWPRPRGLDTEAPLEPPVYGPDLDVRWDRLELGAGVIAKKEEALSSYKSQLSYARPFLQSFVRKNELFADYPPETVRQERGLTHDEWAVRGAGPVEPGVRYAAGDDELFIEVPLVYALDEMGAVSTSVFGYRRGTPFAQMPKLHFKLFGNKLWAFDGGVRYSGRGIFYKIDKSRLLIRVPLDALKRPDHLFAATRTSKNEMSTDFGAWRMIRIEPPINGGQPPAAAIS